MLTPILEITDYQTSTKFGIADIAFLILRCACADAEVEWLILHVEESHYQMTRTSCSVIVQNCSGFTQLAQKSFLGKE